MRTDGPTEQPSFAILGHRERAVELGEPFVDPGGQCPRSIRSNEVGVFVKDRPQRNVAVLNGERDHVAAFRPEEVTTDRHRSAVVPRPIRRKRPLAFEDHDRRRYRRHGRIRKHSRHCFAEALECFGDLPGSLLSDLAKDDEVGRIDAHPFRRSGRSRREQQHGQRDDLIHRNGERAQGFARRFGGAVFCPGGVVDVAGSFDDPPGAARRPRSMAAASVAPPAVSSRR